MSDTNNIDFEALDKDFIKSLNKSLYSRNPNIYALKRAIGRSSEENIKTYISFLNVTKGNIFKPKKEIYFFISTLFYNSERASETEQKYVRYAVLLRRLYMDKYTKSTEMTISRLLMSDIDDSGIFYKQFVHIFRRAVKMLNYNERIDYLSLLKDLKFWNENNGAVRMRWAEKIIY